MALHRHPHRPPSVSLAVVLIAFALAPVSAQTCTSVDTLVLQLPRPVQPEYAGFVVPTSQTVAGAPKFEDECLQVQVQGGGVAFDPLQELKDGRADMAIVEGSYAAQKISNGESLTVIAGYYQKNGLVWIGLNKNAYATLQDLDFKKIGTWGIGYDTPFTTIMGQQNPVVPTTSVTQYSLEQLFSGEIDLASAMIYDELGRPLQQLVDTQAPPSTTNFLKQQSDLYILNPEDYGLTLVHNVLVVNTADVASSRNKLVRFLRIVTRTWHFCRSNEVACVTAFSEYGVPSAHNLWQMKEVNRFIFPSLTGHGLGVLSLERWDAMNTWLVDAGIIASAVSNTVVDNTLALDAGALDDVSQWTPSTSGVTHFCADYGTTAVRVCNGNEHTLCNAGEEPNGSTDYDCKKCQPGLYAPNSQRMNQCLVCDAGRFAKATGQTECELCSVGRFWDPTTVPASGLSATDCTRCPVGRFSSETGASECRNCGEGSMASSEGAAQCDRCPFGTYAGTEGRSLCIDCKESMATLVLGAISQSKCVCPEGTYLPVNGGHCVACMEGMLCGPNSLEQNLLAVVANPSLSTQVGEFPRVLPGYQTLSSAPLDVYLCKGDDMCPGGLPESCGPNMKGLACGQCQAGYYRDGSKCYKCAEIDESTVFNYPLVQIIFGPVVVFILYVGMRNSREDWGSWWNELCSSLFTFFVHYQIIGLLVFTFLQYPDELRSMMMHWSYLVDIPAALRLSCSNYADFRNLFIVKETAPAVLLVIFAITWFLAFLFGHCMRCCCGAPIQEGSRAPDAFKNPGNFCLYLFPFKADVLLNIYLAIFHTFYFCICFIALQLFMCYEHPMKDWSLLLAPEVICYGSEEWKGMLTESVLAILVYIVLPIAAFKYVILLAPTQFHKVVFQTRWKFLFIKFKPDSFWWGVFTMLRTLAICLTLVFSEIGSRQVYYIIVLLLFYTALLVVWWPWRHRSANLFDLLTSCLLIFFCALSVPYSRKADWLEDQLAEWSAATTFSPMIVLALLLCYGAFRRYSTSEVKKRKAHQRELAADCRAAFTKFVALHKSDEQARDEPKAEAQHSICAEEFVRKLSQQDRDILRHGCSVIIGELLGHQPGPSLPWRLVHQDYNGTPAKPMLSGTPAKQEKQSGGKPIREGESRGARNWSRSSV